MISLNQVLITSDSHGLMDELQIIKDRHQLNDNIHCGDSELPIESPYLHGYLTVKGNCDWLSQFSNEKMVEISGLRFFIVHGHHHHVKSSLLKLTLAAKEVEADIICFGHSHIPFADVVDGQLFINPGSIRLPKQYDKPSYAVINWTSRDNVQVNFYDLNGNKLEDLSKKFNIYK